MNLSIPFFITFVALLAVSEDAFSYSAYVQSVHADIYQAPTLNSVKTMSLLKGDAVDVIKESGAFYMVSFEGSKGYIYKFLVDRRKVSSSEKLYSRLRSFFQKIESVSGKSRRRPSSYTSTAAARGLRDKRKNFAGSYTSDYESLSRFESITIGEEEALNFIREGGKDE